MMRDLVQLFAIFCVLFLPVMLIFGRPFIRQWLELKQKRLEIEARLAAEKAAQYATANSELELRVRVLEQIVTDGGLHTASQIEALRSPRLSGREKH